MAGPGPSHDSLRPESSLAQARSIPGPGPYAGSDASSAELAPRAHVQSDMEQTGRRRFDDYEIDLGTGELRRHGQPVALQRHPARVLARLVGRAGTLVPREELHAAVWNDDVHVDFDRGLNYCVRQLRQTLGDDAKTPRFIETVARQGYRFVAVVEPVAYPPRRTAAKPAAVRTPHRGWRADGGSPP